MRKPIAVPSIAARRLIALVKRLPANGNAIRVLLAMAVEMARLPAAVRISEKHPFDGDVPARTSSTRERSVRRRFRRGIGKLADRRKVLADARARNADDMVRKPDRDAEKATAQELRKALLAKHARSLVVFGD